MNHKEKFISLMSELHSKKAKNCKVYSENEYNILLNRLIKLRRTGPCSQNKNDYYIIKQYSLQRVDKNYIIVHKKSGKILVYIDQMYDILQAAHQSTGHGGRQVTLRVLNEKYFNITQEIVTSYIEGCENCPLKRNRSKKGVVVKSVNSPHLNSRCQIDIIDLQYPPDEDYKFIFLYQDHLTKYIRLRPLKTKTAKEVGYNLLDTFTDLGTPCILQSNYGREFVKKIIQEVANIWPACHIVHGKPRDTELQNLVEKEKQNIQDELEMWMQDNNTIKWSEGLRFVQFSVNRCFRSDIGRSPYEAMFGVASRDGLSTLPFSIDIIKTLKTEEELEALLNKSKNVAVSGEQSLKVSESAISDQTGLVPKNEESSVTQTMPLDDTQHSIWGSSCIGLHSGHNYYSDI